MVVGTLGKRGDDYVYNLNLIDIETGKVENRVFEMVAGSKVGPLIAAVQSTADKLLEPKVEPGAVRVTSETRGAMVYLDESFLGSTPVRRDGVEPGAHSLRVEKEGHVGWAKEIEVPAAATLEVKVPLAALTRRRTWPGPAAASMAVLAGLSGVVGIVLDALALQSTTASTRAGAINDAQARFVESFAGNVFLGAAAVLAVTAAIITIAYRHDIFGATTKEERAVEKKRAEVRPWGLAGLEVRW
jgi:hypothetical protein